MLAAFFALERLPGSTYIALFYSYPAMVVVLSALLGERIRPIAWLALALALTGVVLTVPDLTLGAGIDSFGVALALSTRRLSLSTTYWPSELWRAWPMYLAPAPG